MSEEQKPREDEAEDVEAHKKVMAAGDDGGDDEKSDDVEAHQRRAQQHRSN